MIGPALAAMVVVAVCAHLASGAGAVLVNPYRPDVTVRPCVGVRNMGPPRWNGTCPAPPTPVANVNGVQFYT